MAVAAQVVLALVIGQKDQKVARRLGGRSFRAHGVVRSPGNPNGQQDDGQHSRHAARKGNGSIVHDKSPLGRFAGGPGNCSQGTVPFAARKGTGPCFRPTLFSQTTSFRRKMDQSPADL